MKEKIKSVLSYILIGTILLYCFLSYPWIVTTNQYGETVCKDLLGRVSKCQ